MQPTPTDRPRIVISAYSGGMINFGARGHDVTAADFESLAIGLEAQGARCVQLALGKSFPGMPSGPGAINPGMGEYCRATLAAHGVSVAVLGCYVNLTDPDPVRHARAMAAFEAYLRHAPYFGAPVVGTHPGRLGQTAESSARTASETAWREFRGIVERLVAVGERFGTIVGLEPCPHHALHDLDSTERLLREVDSPFLGIILDPAGHAIGDPAGDAAVDPSDPAEREVAVTEEAFRRFGDRIVAFHIKDFTVERSTDGSTAIVPCQIGDGIAPVARLLQIVDRHRPYLPVITEGTRDDRIGEAIRNHSS